LCISLSFNLITFFITYKYKVLNKIKPNYLQYCFFEDIYINNLINEPLNNLTMSCGCKNKANASQAPQPQPQQAPQPNQQTQQTNNNVQETIKKVIEKYYTVKKN